MLSKHFQIVALLAALLHLGDGVVASCSHSHGPSGDHAACGHDHDDAAEPQGPSTPDDDDSHDCAACRHLAQVATHQLVFVELPSVDKVSSLCCQGAQLDVA